MNLPKLAAAMLLASVGTIGWSQSPPEEHAAHHPPGATTSSAPGDDLAPIRALMDRAEHAKSGAERERLLDEHLTAMRKMLGTLEAQPCGMDMMGGKGMGDGPRDGGKPGMMGDGMKDGHMMMCHEMMKSRMETMAELLEQTWRREELRNRHDK
jgi:hypothetical protein